MNHEYLFSAFFTGLKTGQMDFSPISEELRIAIAHSWNSMSEEGLTFVIEPVETELSQPKPNILRLTGSFLYGFKKDGIFHTVPGDLSTEQKRTANETGYFEAHLDDTGSVIGIYESLAGNWFGKKPKKTGLFHRLFG